MGNFVIHNSRRDFSAKAIDQAHEQNNAVIKGDRGANGLTEDPAALRRWMVAGPEVSRLLAAYEAMSGIIDTRIDSRHHEATLGDQTAFFENVKALIYNGVFRILATHSKMSHLTYCRWTRRISQTPESESESE